MLVLDFDGTITDAEREGVRFRAGYLDDLATLTGRPSSEIHALASRFEAEIAKDPDHDGWLYNDHIVAPATVDPYLRIMPVARKILDACQTLGNATERGRLLDVLFKYNYPKTEIVFRPGARELLLALAGQAVHVVTNSHTEPVQKKIRTLSHDGDLDWLLDRVHGEARKYVIDDDFTMVPVSMTLPGLSRPVLLRRRHYHDVLNGLLERAGETWRDLIVVGDIFELDLALPLAMGARVGLVVNQHTPGHEKDFLASEPRGHLIDTLAQVGELVERPS